MTKIDSLVLTLTSNLMDKTAHKPFLLNSVDDFFVCLFCVLLKQNKVQLFLFGMCPLSRLKSFSGVVSELLVLAVLQSLALSLLIK